MVAQDSNDYISDGIKVLVNPDERYFHTFQKFISATEGWNYRAADYKFCQKFYKEFYFLFAVHEETDEIVCAVSLSLNLTKGGSKIYTIGNYYCVDKWRGKGIANKLFAKCVKLIGDNNASLYGAVKMTQLYSDVYKFSLIKPFWYCYALINCNDLCIPTIAESIYKAKDIVTESDWRQVLDYDLKISNLDRRDYMKANLLLTGTTARFTVNSNGEITAYGSIRYIYNDEILISPLYADNYESALVLTVELLKSVNSITSFKNIVVLYPEVNKGMERLLEIFSNGKFTTRREYRNQFTKEILEFDVEKTFAIDECSYNPV